jgi:hypothetical protein
MSGLRAPEGGVKVRTKVDPRDELRRRLIDLWVSDYDAALKRENYELAGRVATALREDGRQTLTLACISGVTGAASSSDRGRTARARDREQAAS